MEFCIAKNRPILSDFWVQIPHILMEALWSKIGHFGAPKMGLTKLPIFGSPKNRSHIYSIARQLIASGWNPDDLYTFIYVSEGGKGLRLNTIQVNYLKSLASF